MARIVFSVGHSTLSADAFVEVLTGAGVRCVADVRMAPGSRRHPHFAGPALAARLGASGIAYHWLQGLGGRRRSTAPSPHVAWQVAAFRAYADYMDTPAFADALAALTTLAAAAPTAFLCAEALWWQCHRRLIADRLLAEGWTVRHLSARGTATHALPEFARLEAGRLVYDRGTTPPLAAARGGDEELRPAGRPDDKRRP